MNNDISNFEKVVLVDSIPSEDDARDLSIRYPFALFLTDPQPHAFANIWKGGHRFTKFNNVNPRAKSVNLDTYSIDLDFDLETGLLSLNAVAKVDGYKVVGFLYKTGNEQYRTFLNKIELESLITYDQSVEGERTITNISREEWEEDRDSFDHFESYTFESTLNTINEIDAADNKFYMIVSYESKKQDSLYSVPASAYSIYSNDSEFSITANPMFAEDKLKQVINIENVQAKNALINKILKYTDNVTYNDTYQRCVIYEISVNENIEPDSPDDQTKISFSFESLKNLQPIDIQLTYAYINPTEFNITAFVNNEWVDVILDGERENYLMPGETSQIKVEILPQNVRKLRLDSILTTRAGQSSMEFKIGESNASTGSTYNYDINIANSETTNIMQFTLVAPSDFTKDISKRADLEIKISKKIRVEPGFEVIDSADWKYVKISQYVYRELDLPANPWSYAGISTSGNEIDYLLTYANAVFTNDSNTVSKKKAILPSDTLFLVNLLMHPKNNGNVEIATISSPLILNASNIPAATLEANNISINEQTTITIPWIKSTDVNGNQTTDYIDVWYRYHGYETNTHKKYIKEDNLISISIKKNVGTISAPNYEYSLNFTKNSYGGSEPLYIEKIANKNIIFKYANGQEVDGYHWYFDDSMTTLKNYLQVYSTIAGQQNSTITNIPTTSISIESGKIKINSLSDTDNARNYYAYIKYGNLESDLINASTERLMVDWWIYVGARNGNNPSIQWESRTENPAFTYNATKSNMGAGLIESEKFVVHTGGWIHLGQVDLTEARFQRTNTSGIREYTSRQKIIWESIPEIIISVEGNIEIGDTYLVIIPSELQIEDGIGVTGDFVDNYTFSGNLGTYTGWEFQLADKVTNANNVSTAYFPFAIVHK